MAQCFLPIPFACDGWAPRKAICSWWFVWARTKKYFLPIHFWRRRTRRRGSRFGAPKILHGAALVRSAQKTSKEDGVSPRDPSYSWQVSPSETRAVVDAFHDALAEFRTNPPAAQAFLKQANAKPIPRIDDATYAAWAVAGSVILNLDEVVMR